MEERSPVVLSWSGGKDSALALAALRAQGERVHCLLTTVTEDYDRISMHGVRRALLRAQADALKVPLREVEIPKDCPNTVYESRLGDAVRSLAEEGVRRYAFGDLFLEDVRRYREEHLVPHGMEALFPIWGEDTLRLGKEFVALGYKAVLVVVDPGKLPQAFLGRDYDEALLRDLPPEVDPCGERGEFHSFVWDGPIFSRPVPVRRGEAVLRDGFWFQDLLPAVST